MAESISLQEVKDRYGLTDQQLGEGVNRQHLREASRFIADHKILGLELGLTSAEMAAINQDQSQELQRLVMLEKWKQRFAWKATYHKLIDALLKCNRADLVQQVCELLASSKCKHRAVRSCMQHRVAAMFSSLMIAGTFPGLCRSNAALPNSPLSSYDTISMMSQHNVFTSFHDIVIMNSILLVCSGFNLISSFLSS